MIDFAETFDSTEDYASIDDTYAIIRGNVKNTNYEIIEIPANECGAGYFQVEIVLNGTAQSSGFTRLGLAWEQP